MVSSPSKNPMRYRLLRLLDQYGRLFPLWFRCLFAGLVLSYVVAIVCWISTEAGYRKRAFIDADLQAFSGTDAVIWLYQSKWLSDSRIDWHHAYANYVTGYGWPIASWGSVWAASASPRALAGIDVAPLWPPDANGDQFQRVIPIYPLWGQTAIVSTMWGTLFYVSILVYQRLTRPHKDGCPACGYPLVPHMKVCPECGKCVRHAPPP